MAAGRLPGRVQLDQLGGDLTNRLAGPALALGPVRAAHLVQRRILSADVAGYLVKRVHRHVEPVARLAASGRRVLDHQVLPRCSRPPSVAPSRRSDRPRAGCARPHRQRSARAGRSGSCGGPASFGLPCRRTRWPDRSAAVNTASRISSARNPWLSSPVTTRGETGGRCLVERGRGRGPATRAR